ncbi:MAG: hypothetical protein JNM72_18835 [Deltaproteobacteria bacterium]|nr:hypothetical protein [Deltaproteobacteria bacterium]
MRRALLSSLTPPRSTGPLLLLLAACNGDKEPAVDQGTADDGAGDDAAADGGADDSAGGDGGAAVTGALDLALSAAEAAAGEPVPYSLTLRLSDGQEVIFDELPSSDQGEVRGAADGALVLTRAADHALSVSVEHEGVVYTDTAAISIVPGPVSALDLALSDLAMPAGGSVDWSLSAADRFGNAIDVGALAPLADHEGLTLSGAGAAGAVSGTTPGAWTLSATLDGVTDTEAIVVLSGPPAAVVLSLSDSSPELLGTTTATVEVVDTFGNPSVAPWTLSVSGPTMAPGDVALSYRNLTFYEEGAYTVRVDVDDTALFDEVGPIYVDSTGPLIDIDSPTRGDWNSGLDLTVTGEVSDSLSGVSALTVDGAPVSTSAGAFSTTLSLEPGINVVETSATDGDGNVSTDSRAVLAGTFVPWGQAVADGFLVRIHEGAGGFNTIESLGEGLIAATDLTTLIPNPVLNRVSQTCTLGVCVTWYSIVLRVRNPSIGATTLDLDPRTTGNLRGTFVVNDVELDWTASGKIAGVNYSGSGTVTADSLRVVVDMLPSVNSAGDIVASVSSVTATAVNFDFNVSGTVYDVLAFFGLDSTISGLIEGYVLDAIEDAVRTEVPTLVEDALQDLEISLPLPVSGRTYTVNAVPDTVSVDAVGLTLGLETTVTPDRWIKGNDHLGSLVLRDTVSSWDRAAGTWLGINLDFFNQALMAFWGGGLLDQRLSGAALGLDVADLQVLLPGLTELNLTLEALLPPVTVPDGVDAMAELQLGDMLLTLYNGPAVAGNEMIQVYFSAFIEMDLAANADATAVEITLGDMNLTFDVVIPEAASAGAADTEALLQLLVPLLLPTLTDALSEIPIPDIEGFGLSGVTVDMLGGQGAVIGLGGDLAAR